MRAVAAFLAVVAFAGCVQPSLIVCGELVCPRDTACVALETNGQTCLPIANCDRAGLGDACDPGNGQEGTCEGGGCRPIERCGNGIVDSGETCDCGDEQIAPRAECNARNNSDSDPLSPCRGDCQLRTCGDEQLDATEQCEGTAIADGLSCETFGYYEGDLACSSLCVVDRANCSRRCGDGTIDADHEYCDPLAPEIAGYCTDFGFSSGTLRCGSTCGPRFQDCTDGFTFTELLPGNAELREIVRGPTPTSAWVLASNGLWLYDESTGIRSLGAPSTGTFVDVSSFGARAAVSTSDAKVYLHDGTGAIIATLSAPAPCRQIAMTAEDTFACLGTTSVSWWSAGTWDPPLAAPAPLAAIARPDGSVIYTSYLGGTGQAAHAQRATRTNVAPMPGWSSTLQTFHEITVGSGPTTPGLYGGLAYGGSTYGMVKLASGDVWTTVEGSRPYLQIESVGGRQFALRRYVGGHTALLSNRASSAIDPANTSCQRFLGTGSTALCLTLMPNGFSMQLYRYAGATTSQIVPLTLATADVLSDAVVDDNDIIYYVGRAGATGNTSPSSSWRPPTATGVIWDQIGGIHGTNVVLLGRVGVSYTSIALWTSGGWFAAPMSRVVTAAIPVGGTDVLVSATSQMGGCDLLRGPPSALVVIDHVTTCLTTLWASPTGHLWGASRGFVRDITARQSRNLVPSAQTGWLAGRDDTHVWLVAGTQIWFYDGATWTLQLDTRQPTDFDWVSTSATGVLATARKPAQTTWLLFESETVPTWNKLRLPSDTTIMVKPQLRPWGVVFRTLDGTLRYSVWENGWPQ